MAENSNDFALASTQNGSTGSGPPAKSFRSSNKFPNGKKTKGRVKIKMEFIDNKLRRYTTFSKRKTGIMKKAYELSTLTGTQVMLLVASETGHVYTFATRKLQPMITSEAGKALIQTCLNTPETGDAGDAEPSMQDFMASEIGKSRSLLDDDIAKLAKRSSPNDGLPTMVPPSSSYSGSYHDDDSDMSEDESNAEGRLLMSEGVESDRDSPSAKSDAASNSHVDQLASPDKSDQDNVINSLTNPLGAAFAANLGLLTSLAASGALMYQLPQGLVYSASNGTMAQNAGANFLLGIPQQSADAGNNNVAQQQQQQQFITIPVPFSFNGATSTNNNNVLSDSGAVANTMASSLITSSSTTSKST